MTQREATPAEAYEDYFVPAIFEPLAKVVLEHAAPRPGDRVLDVACGTGIVARRAAAVVGASGRVVGIDCNPGMIAVAETVSSGSELPIEYRTGDALALDLPDRSFDLLICQQGVQFFPDRSTGLKEFRRVLIGGGRAVTAVWQGLDRHPLYAMLAEAEEPHLRALGAGVTADDANAPFSFGDPEDLRSLMTDVGFANVEVVSGSIEARFATPAQFIERMAYAYVAVVPQFITDPAVFARFVDQVGYDAAPILDDYRQGDNLVVPMHANIAVGHA